MPCGSVLKLHREGVFGEVSNTPLQSETLGYAPFSETGTGFAINNLSLGVPPNLPRKPNRGGARNRADRESHGLSAKQIATLIAAKDNAALIGLPFTRMITIHWEAAGVSLADMVKATGRFIDLLSKTIARHKGKAAWIWVHEGGDGKGGHCHILAHIPPGTVSLVTGLQKRWLRSITGRKYKKGVIRSDPIGRRLGLETGNPALHTANLNAAFGYICKAAPQAVLDAYGIERAHAPGGLVIGKRCAASQNLNVRARATPGGGWKPCRDDLGDRSDPFLSASTIQNITP